MDFNCIERIKDLLRLRSGQLYLGATEDLNRRYQEHLCGKACRTTRLDPPVALLHAEQFPTFSDARKREAQVKRLASQLRNDDFQTREAATEALIAMGREMLPLLKKAVGDSPDPEVLIRLKWIADEVDIRSIADVDIGSISDMETGAKTYVTLAKRLSEVPGKEVLRAKLPELAKRLDWIAARDGEYVNLANTHFELGMLLYRAYRSSNQWLPESPTTQYHLFLSTISSPALIKAIAFSAKRLPMVTYPSLVA